MLTEEEKKVLQEKGEIIIVIDSINRHKFSGLTGNLKINKVKRKYCQTMIGVWTCENYKSTNGAIIQFDSLGKMILYKEFNKNNVVTFDCIYTYKLKGDILYRIENHIIRYDSGETYLKGGRYRKLKKSNKCPYYKFVSRQIKFGTFEYFDKNGSLIESKIYRELVY